MKPRLSSAKWRRTRLCARWCMTCVKRRPRWQRPRGSPTSRPPPICGTACCNGFRRKLVLWGTVPPQSAVPVAAGKIVRPIFSWVPWACAALLLGCCVVLAWNHQTLTRQVARLAQLDRSASATAHTGPDVFSQVAFCELEPTPDAPVRPRAAVLWDAAERKGVLRISELAPPAAGKDYQLWAVKAGSKQPVNAGVVHLDAVGHADVSFQPDTIPGDNQVVALALSVEKAGGSPTNQGPILFLGKL